PLLGELGSERPLLVSSERWRDLALPVRSRFHGARPHAPVETVAAAIAAAEDADAVGALGSGRAIDTGEAGSAARRTPLGPVPATYAGSEWTPYYGSRNETQRTKGGGSGALLAGAVYEPRLTLGLPRAETVGTARNALAHCAEALYVRGDNAEADAHAPARGRVEAGNDREARTGLLRGACEAGAALGGSGLALGHALAQALGGRYGLPHGALNAICLAPALRFNEPVAGDAIRRFGRAIGFADAA